MQRLTDEEAKAHAVAAARAVGIDQCKLTWFDSQLEWRSKTRAPVYMPRDLATAPDAQTYWMAVLWPWGNRQPLLSTLHAPGVPSPLMNAIKHAVNVAVPDHKDHLVQPREIPAD